MIPGAAVPLCRPHHHGLLVESLVRIVPPGAPRGRRRVEVDALHVERADGDETHGAREAQQEHAHGEQLLGVKGAGPAVERPQLPQRVEGGRLSLVIEEMGAAEN